MAMQWPTSSIQGDVLGVYRVSLLCLSGPGRMDCPLSLGRSIPYHPGGMSMVVPSRAHPGVSLAYPQADSLRPQCLSQFPPLCSGATDPPTWTQTPPGGQGCSPRTWPPGTMIGEWCDSHLDIFTRFYCRGPRVVANGSLSTGTTSQTHTTRCPGGQGEPLRQP